MFSQIYQPPVPILNFLLNIFYCLESFRFTEKLRRYNKYFSHNLHSVSPDIFIIFYEWVLIHYYELKSIVHSDILSCFLISFFCSRIPCRISPYSNLPCLLRLFLAVTISLISMLLMILTVLSITSQIFFRTSIY